MTANNMRETLLQLLYELRPEAARRTLPPDAELREELDLDSMDFLNFVIAVDAATGVEIPEADYGRLSTLNDCVRYIEHARHRSA
jgi:acyl carrier protein